MKSLLLLVLILICQSESFAQDQASVILRAGSKISDAFSFSDMFYYPKFTKGRVSFKDGSKSEANLNYNYLIDEMNFINQKGDTLAVANPETIKYISINTDTFYFEQGFIKLVARNDVVKLGQKQLWRANQSRKTGAFGSTNPAASVASYYTATTVGGQYDLVANEDLELRKINEYYFGDKFNHFVLANKKNLLNLMPNEQSEINSYLKENKVDFNNSEDLYRLIKFLEKL